MVTRNPAVAHVPSPDDVLHEHAPLPHVTLRLVQVVHRHGHRSTIVPLDELVAPDLDLSGRCLPLSALLPVFGDDAETIVGYEPVRTAEAVTGAAAASASSLLGAGRHGPHLAAGRGSSPSPSSAVVSATRKRVVRLSGCRAGELTKDGYLVLKQIGNYMRHLYVSKFQFLSSVWINPTDILLRTTDFSRTRESLRSLLAGLYDLKMRDLEIPNGCDTANTLFTYKAFRCDPLLASTDMLPLAGEQPFATTCLSIADVEARLPKQLYNDIFQFNPDTSPLRRVYDRAASSFRDFASFKDSISLAYDNAACARGHDMSLLLSDQELDILGRLHHWVFFGNYDDFQPGSEKTRVAIARFAKEFLELPAYVFNATSFLTSCVSVNCDDDPELLIPEFSFHHELMQLNGNQASPPKLALYSAHDTTISPFLGVLGLAKDEWPKYASYIICEYWEDSKTQDVLVRVRYNGELMQISVLQSIGNDSVSKHFYKFKDFFKMVSDSAMSQNDHDELLESLKTKNGIKNP